ncbi:MAG TPA: ABC transporter permease [Gammaproteobacteria bacterium]|nr:ABC transporter permease [Gammaproteobacteria bacterium]
MSKVLQIAWREFRVTVMSKAFIIGLLLLPAMGALMAVLVPRLFNLNNVEVKGEVAIIDPDGRVADALAAALDPAAIEARRKADAERVTRSLPGAAQAVAGGAVQRSIEAAAAVDLRLVRPEEHDVEREKAWLYAAPSPLKHLALIVVHPDAVSPAEPGGRYGSYDLYVPPHLDDRVEGEIRRNLHDAIVAARVRSLGLDIGAIAAAMDVPRVPAVTVSAEQERRAVSGLNILAPLAFGFLLFMGVMTGGQALLTSTVEEKASRVIEVLLSAVSPMQLMAGKLLGHMAVSLVAMSVYVGLGLMLLTTFAVLGLVDLSLIGYLVIFFVLTYLVLGSLMMAVGSAVNDMREAQTLMTPIMILIILPWLLWMPISRDPNAAFSVAMSFVPPVNSFVMLLRMASSTPPPLWQVWASIGVGAVAVFGAVWFGAKVLRIGLLMYGKPPNLATLIRWARAA